MNSIYKKKPLSKDHYVSFAWDQCETYIKGVLDGSIRANRWIKLAVKRFISDVKRKDLDYRTKEVDRVFRFFSVLRITGDGEQFRLMPFQAFTLANLFGFYKKGTERRKYNYAFLFMSRKNGKTAFIAALNLYFMIADGVHFPQCLMVASSREQASICSSAAADIVMNTPSLYKRLYVQGPLKSRNTIVFKDPKKSGVLKTLISQSRKLDGYNTSCAVLDEVHSYQDDSLFNVIKSSTGRRFSNGESPLVTLISTAGFNVDSHCAELVNMGKGVLEGKQHDDSFFFLLYTLDEGDDFDDESVWIKANPALGDIMDIDYLKNEYAQAKNLPSQLPNFLTKHCNIFVQQISAWIPEHIIDKVMIDTPIEEIKDFGAFVGIDLSSTRDLTSMVVVVYDQDKDVYHVFPYFFRADNPDKRFRVGGIDLTQWIDKGYITQCKSATIDYDLILETFKDISGKFNINSVQYDDWNSALLIPKIQELGFMTENFPQNTKHFNLPLKITEGAIYNGNINLSSNPVLKWNFNNSVLYYDGNGNAKIMKNKSLDSVDGAVALLMAMKGAVSWYNLSIK